MKFPIYTYRDLKVAFMQPICEVSDSSAIRGFAYAVNSKEGLMNYSPSDFQLYRIGTFDNEKGTIESCLPELITDGDAVYGVKQK